MSAYYAVHIADQRNAPSIRRRGLIVSDSTGLWLGRGAYYSLCLGAAHFDECVEYGKSFVQAKADYSGEYAVVVSAIDPVGMVRVQDPRVRRALERFKLIFLEQLDRCDFELPRNSDYQRPRSFAMFQTWRTLANQALLSRSGAGPRMWIRSTLCRFVGNPKSDAPIEHPYEVCAHEAGVERVVFVGTAEEAKRRLHEELDGARSLEAFYIDRDLEIAGATHEAAHLVSQMQRADISALLKRLTRPSSASPARRAIETRRQPGVGRDRGTSACLAPPPQPRAAEARRAVSLERLERHVRAKNLNKEVLLRDLDKVFRDFERRNRDTDQLELPIEDVVTRIGALPSHAEGAARMLIARFLKNSDANPVSAILKQLPVEVRNIDGLEGQAYFFPRGEITERSVLAVRRSIAGEAETMFDRAHELGHFVFHECAMTEPDEEAWCDRFAAALLEASRQADRRPRTLTTGA